MHQWPPLAYRSEVTIHGPLRTFGVGAGHD